MMPEVEKNCLTNFFEVINNSFEYVVMRNAEELPFYNFSNDIDILIDETEYSYFEKTMKNVFLKHGFERVERTSFHGIECYTFYNINHEKVYSLKIDLFFNIEGGGVRYFEFKDVLKYRTRNANGIFVFEQKIEAFLTALKTFAAGGTLKEKYLEFFLENPLDKDHELYNKCKSRSLKNNLIYLSEFKKNPIDISRSQIVKQTFIKSFKSQGVLSLIRLTQHYRLELSRLFKKKNIIVLVGPDGSGKTTMINQLKEDSKKILRSIPQRISVFHHRPHLFRNISDLLKKDLNEEESNERNFNPHSGKVSNQLISILKLIYYSLDYRLGYVIKIMPLQRRNNFVIFDRYYYDFIVDQRRAALNTPEKISLLIYKLIIPKPNTVFFIKTDPVEAHNRKKELPVEMIDKINSSYERLAEKFNYFRVIPNKDFEKSYNEFLRSFIIATTDSIK